LKKECGNNNQVQMFLILGEIVPVKCSVNIIKKLMLNCETMETQTN